MFRLQNYLHHEGGLRAENPRLTYFILITGQTTRMNLWSAVFIGSNSLNPIAQ